MSDRTARHTRPGRRGTASVALVLALAGVIFSANARLASGQEGRHPQDLASLSEVEADRVAVLAQRVDGLREQVDELTARQPVSVDTGDPRAVTLIDIASGRAPVTGPGVTVRLTDAPYDGALPPNVSPDDLVVHQQDLQSVINALWAGGAEAMALQDQRVTATTAYRCVGNVLSLGGRLYSPPYEVRAIGDPKELRAALLAAPGVIAYLKWVDAYGLGWSVTNDTKLELPGTEGGTELRFATTPEGMPVFPTDGVGGAVAVAARADEATALR
ncbi:DUF881 domain-containing protein [Cellulomonas fimi]|uniref:DUF881 domain-containing protein n=1 Tax=Cellulomonas fimi TaxID=1708 RepID=UPI00289349F3|nr:DUF881 domain-containing protein [Cellulomonas fimi]